MPFTHFCCEISGEPVSVADCIAHAQSEGGRLSELVGRNGERCPFTPAILRGIAQALVDEPMPEGAIRVTHLLSCAKRTQWQATNDYAVRPGDGYALFRGQLGHAMVEGHHGDEILLSEERLTIEFGGILLTGKPDAVLNTAEYHIDDYKTTRRLPHEPYEHHIAQVNLYAWLIEKTRAVKIETASIVYLDMGGVSRLPVSVWPRKKTERFMREQILRWQAGTPRPSVWECKTCPMQTLCDVVIPTEPRRLRGVR